MQRARTELPYHFVLCVSGHTNYSLRRVLLLVVPTGKVCLLSVENASKQFSCCIVGFPHSVFNSVIPCTQQVQYNDSRASAERPRKLNGGTRQGHSR